MAELSAGSLSHFYLRSLVRGGKGITHYSAVQNLVTCGFSKWAGQNKFPMSTVPPVPPTETPAILVSPAKQRKPAHTDSQSKIKASTPDEAVWDLPDDDIIGTLHVLCSECISDATTSCLCQILEVTSVQLL